MMTKRHRLYLQRYPERIGRERRLRRLKVKGDIIHKRHALRAMRSILFKHVASRPKAQPIRVGKQTIGTRIKNFFRKPTV